MRLLDNESTDYAVHFSGLYCNNSYLFFLFFIHNENYIAIYDRIHKILLYGNLFEEIKNDIDSGPPFFMMGLFDDYLIGTIEPADFIKHFDSLKSIMGEEKWEKFMLSHPNINKILNTVAPKDNPILMLCYLKDKFRYEN